MADMILTGGLIADGGASKPWPGSVVITDGRITEVGDVAAPNGATIIDVDGLVVAPGFIDLHTHTDFSLPTAPSAETYTRQGVTLHVTGNCGLTPFPVGEGDRGDLLRSSTRFLEDDLNWDWTSPADFVGMMKALPLAPNVVLQVGHSAVRTGVMGFDRRQATAQELDAMRGLVDEAFEAGIKAFSTGLIYAPGSYAGTDEVVALAEVAARHGGFYSTHLRAENHQLLEAMDEAVQIAQAAGIGVEFSHHKAAGEGNWGLTRQSLARLDELRAAGMDVMADVYPYTASSTTILAWLPGWATEGGPQALAARLADPGQRSAMAGELRNNTGRGFSPDRIVLATPPSRYAHAQGMSIADLAAVEGISPEEAVLRLVDHAPGGVGIIHHSMSDDDVDRVLSHPAVSVASDGWVLERREGMRPHPRSAGTFVRVLGHYVRERSLLDLGEAVRKMTSLPATRLGLTDRGRLVPGYAADVVAFDPDTVRDAATFAEPFELAVGVHHVIVNGELVISDGQPTGAAPGRVLTG